MLIESSLMNHFTGGETLILSCYSYQESEFDSVRYVIQRAKVDATTERIQSETDDRIGIRFTIWNENIRRLENFLKIRFDNFGRKELKGDGSSPFKCERVVVLSQRRECKTIYADDEHSASVICALVAKDKGWFGGVSEPGQCR
jgi:hypothetical protein